jgi:hypothetical protein
VQSGRTATHRRVGRRSRQMGWRAQWAARGRSGGQSATLSRTHGRDPCGIDLAHASGSQQPQDPVPGEGLPDPQRHGVMLTASIRRPRAFRKDGAHLQKCGRASMRPTRSGVLRRLRRAPRPSTPIARRAGLPPACGSSCQRHRHPGRNVVPIPLVRGRSGGQRSTLQHERCHSNRYHGKRGQDSQEQSHSRSVVTVGTELRRLPSMPRTSMTS